MASHELRLWTRSFSTIDGSNDDDVFRNVSLITMGEAKGHNCQIDDVTLQQLLDCSKRFRNGVRANLGHFTGVENSFAYFTNLHIEGEKLQGDLNLFSEHPGYRLTKKQIQTIPDTMGFSVYFDGPDEVKMIPDSEGKEVPVNFARCQVLFSADLVPEPAANPSGVFSRGKDVESITVDKSVTGMATKALELSPEIKDAIKDCMGEMMKTHADHMDKMSGKMDDLYKKVEEIGTDDTTVKETGLDDEKDKEKEDKVDDSTKMSALIEKNNKALRASIVDDVLKAFSEQKISPDAAKTAGNPDDGKNPKALEKGKEDESKPKTFHEAYRAIRALGKGKSESLKLAQAQHPELNKAYCLAQENGEAWANEPLDKKTYTALQLQGKLR